MHAIGVSNPNVPIFPPRVCTLVLFIIIMLPGPGPVLCMIRERHVILKAALHSRLPVQQQLAIIMLYCPVYIRVYSYNFYVSLGNLAIVSLIPKLLHCTYDDTMIMQFYY